MQSRQLKWYIRQLEEINCKMAMCGVYGKGFAAVLWMQWTEHYCHFKGKRRCCNDQAVSCELGQVQWEGGCERETHIQHDSRRNWRDLDRMRCWAVEEQGWWPTVIMKEILQRFWGRALRALFVANRQLGFHRKVLCSFEFRQPNFSFHHLLCSA